MSTLRSWEVGSVGKVSAMHGQGPDCVSQHCTLKSEHGNVTSRHITSHLVPSQQHWENEHGQADSQSLLELTESIAELWGEGEILPQNSGMGSAGEDYSVSTSTLIHTHNHMLVPTYVHTHTCTYTQTS